jgi:hypothetical protein
MWGGLFGLPMVVGVVAVTVLLVEVFMPRLPVSAHALDCVRCGVTTAVDVERIFERRPSRIENRGQIVAHVYGAWWASHELYVQLDASGRVIRYWAED